MNSIVIRTSEIHGMGVFAARNFSAGEIIIDWSGCTQVLAAPEVERLPDDERKCVSRIDEQYVLLNPPARFVNHSCTPNARGAWGTDIALRHIAQGEEITVDYVIEQVPGLNLTCNCAAPTCRGVLTLPAEVIDGFASDDQIHFRNLLPGDDLEALTLLLHDAYAPLAAAGMRFVASHQDVEVTRRRIAKGETFVATRGDSIVGTIALAEVAMTHGTPFYDRPDVADFGQFAVLPSLQGRGIGSRLIEMVERRAFEKGVSELALNTSEHATDLIAMYTRKGFRFIEYARWSEVNYRSVILSKTLTVSAR